MVIDKKHVKFVQQQENYLLESQMPWVSGAETHFFLLLIILTVLFYVFLMFHHDPPEMAVMTTEWKIQYKHSTYILTVMSNAVSQ